MGNDHRQSTDDDHRDVFWNQRDKLMRNAGNSYYCRFCMRYHYIGGCNSSMPPALQEDRS